MHFVTFIHSHFSVLSYDSSTVDIPTFCIAGKCIELITLYWKENTVDFG